jgi:hypothetical protein
MVPAVESVPRHYPLLLGALTFLFACRVLGQFVAGVADVAWLPPFERWYSGLMPYAALLPVQLAMIAVMLKIVWDFACGHGLSLRPGPRIGTILLWFSCLYALAMVTRYVVTMLMKPELRWFTGTIPIWFHFVLAAFIYTLGRYYVRDRSAGGQEP